VTKPHGVRVLTELPLPPGRYQLRVAGGSQVGRAGSVTYDVQIPDYPKEPFVLSGVALTSSAARDTFTITPSGKPLGIGLPTPITAAREFRADETVTLYAEVYENPTRAPHSNDFTVELSDNSGREATTFSAKNPSSGLAAYQFVAPIPLKGVTPGVYTIHVAASANAKLTAMKDIQIRVR
jgi:hypothetical protein